MKAVILAGGRGRRLEPYTTVLPKPLVPVGDMPILEIVIRQLAAAGFTEITLTLGYLGELIRAFFLQHRKLSGLVDLRFVDEEQPTGTAGSLTRVPGLDETFLVMNGDVLTSLDYRALVEHHRRAGADLTIAAHQKDVKIDLGVMQVDEAGGRVTGYVEKPDYHFLVSMGVYVYEPEALEHIPADTYFDFPSLVLKLIAAERRVSYLRSRDVWFDIGRPEDHRQAQEWFETNRALLAGLE